MDVLSARLALRRLPGSASKLTNKRLAAMAEVVGRVLGDVISRLIHH
jgi:hypothetical protein